MLDMGFIPDVERIVGLIPRIRQTLFFSATMPPEIRRLADAFLMNPKEISVSPPASPAELVEQHLVMTTTEQKREALRALIAREDIRNALIFCNRKRDVAILLRSLQRHGFDAAALHGDMTQDQRFETLEKFKRNEVKLLVCSDVAARGLDIQFLSHVFNFDVPHNAEDYIHRIGRTGRAGRSGRSIMLATPADGKAVAAVERLIQRQIPRLLLPEFALPEGTEAPPAPDRRPRRGERAVGRRNSRRPERAPRPQTADSNPALDSGAGLAAEPGVAVSLPGDRIPVPAPAAATVEEALPPRRERGGHRRHEPDEEREPRVVGMGDHVPAFLLRSIKLSSR